MSFALGLSLSFEKLTVNKIKWYLYVLIYTVRNLKNKNTLIAAHWCIANPLSVIV